MVAEAPARFRTRLESATGRERHPDLLATARGYETTTLTSALWSLDWSARAWVEAMNQALATRVVLQHANRGPQRAEDVARSNAHDAHHHLRDIGRILG